MNRLNIEQRDEQVRKEFREQDRSKIVQLWLQNMNYRQIAQQTKASLGTISSEIEKVRKVEPNLDSLRELNATLKKSGVGLLDAIKACPILLQLGELGVSLDRLESFIKLSDRISSEPGVEAERFVESAVKLMKLEGETGKNYGGVIKDFEEKLSEIAKLEGKIEALKGDIQKLMEARVQIEGELTKAQGNLTNIVQELKRAVSAKERLEKMGLERLNALAEFIEDFEGLGFDAQEVQKLAEWRKSLAEAGIDPDKLESFIRVGGPLVKQLQAIKEEISQGKTQLRILRMLSNK